MQKFVFLFNLNPIFHHSTLLKIFNRPCTSQKTVLELKLVFSSKKKESNNPIQVGRHAKNNLRFFELFNFACIKKIFQ